MLKIIVHNQKELDMLPTKFTEKVEVLLPEYPNEPIHITKVYHNVVFALSGIKES